MKNLGNFLIGLGTLWSGVSTCGVWIVGALMGFYFSLANYIYLGRNSLGATLAVYGRGGFGIRARHCRNSLDSNRNLDGLIGGAAQG